MEKKNIIIIGVVIAIIVLFFMVIRNEKRNEIAQNVQNVNTTNEVTKQETTEIKQETKRFEETNSISSYEASNTNNYRGEIADNTNIVANNGTGGVDYSLYDYYINKHRNNNLTQDELYMAYSDSPTFDAYQIYDYNKDGVDELIIFSKHKVKHSTGNGTIERELPYILAIYSIENGQVTGGVLPINSANAGLYTYAMDNGHYFNWIGASTFGMVEYDGKNQVNEYKKEFNPSNQQFNGYINGRPVTDAEFEREAGLNLWAKVGYFPVDVKR